MAHEVRPIRPCPRGEVELAPPALRGVALRAASDRSACDIIVEALGGVTSLNGPEGGPSVRAGVPIGDLTAGIFAVIGLLGALEQRRRNGRGEHIDISMLDSQVSLLSCLAQYYLTGGLVAGHQGRAHVSIPTYNTFASRDGTEVVVAASTEEMWRLLCQVLGRADLIADPRFRTGADRLAHREDLVPQASSVRVSPGKT